MANLNLKPYSNDYMNAWIITYFMHSQNQRPLAQIQAGLRLHLNHDPAFAKSGLPEEFLTFVNSRFPEITQYANAERSWVEYVKTKYLSDFNYQDSKYSISDVHSYFMMNTNPVRIRSIMNLAFYAVFQVTNTVLITSEKNYPIEVGLILLFSSFIATFAYNLYLNHSPREVCNQADRMQNASLDTPPVKFTSYTEKSNLLSDKERKQSRFDLQKRVSSLSPKFMMNS